MKKEKTKQNISITVTEDILAFMRAQSEIESISLSAYVRRLVLSDMKGKQNGTD